jgi:hypothetical protein
LISNLSHCHRGFLSPRRTGKKVKSLELQHRRTGTFFFFFFFLNFYEELLDRNILPIRTNLFKFNLCRMSALTPRAAPIYNDPQESILLDNIFSILEENILR